MASYVVHVRSSMAPAEAFAYMADLTNFAEWDDGVARSEQVAGDGPGPGSSFDVDVKLPVGTMTLRYGTTAYDEGMAGEASTMTAIAENLIFRSEDTITVVSDGGGSIVTYDAELTLRGPLGLSDPFLSISFKQIGDRATRGLIEALDGERIDEPVPAASR